MVPSIVYYVPSFIMMARWPLAGGNNILGQGGTGFVNQWPSLLILGLLNVYYIFLMRQTFYSIPRDFEEAARVDGANTWQILVRVYLPMLAPSLAVLFIFQTIAIWNDYVWPLMSVGGNVDLWPTALGFQRLMLSGTRLAGSPAISDFPWALTVAVIATLPLIVMFIFLQRYFVEGVQGFALKG
jgi:multiple sugar transport system permease protein